ncbi:MAG: RHS repeat-associated core domain-containing protein, partial [Acidimicrobiales bacterium]
VHRYYDPSTEQFVSVDPLVSKTQTPYSYAGGDPVNGTDPSGECSCTVYLRQAVSFADAWAIQSEVNEGYLWWAIALAFGIGSGYQQHEMLQETLNTVIIPDQNVFANTIMDAQVWASDAAYFGAQILEKAVLIDVYCTSHGCLVGALNGDLASFDGRPLEPPGDPTMPGGGQPPFPAEMGNAIEMPATSEAAAFHEVDPAVSTEVFSQLSQMYGYDESIG